MKVVIVGRSDDSDYWITRGNDMLLYGEDDETTKLVFVGRKGATFARCAREKRNSFQRGGPLCEQTHFLLNRESVRNVQDQ